VLLAKKKGNLGFRREAILVNKKAVVGKGDRRALGQDPWELSTEQPVQITGRWDGNKGGEGVFGQNGKLGVEAGDEILEKEVGLWQVMNPCQCQLDRKPALQCIPEALDPPLGLWRMSGEHVDAQTVENPAELCYLLLKAGQLFLNGKIQLLLRIDEEHTVTVRVEGLRDPEIRECLPEYFQVTEQALIFAQIQAGEHASGIVNEAMECKGYGTAEPGKWSGICLQHGTGGKLAFAGLVQLGRSSPFLGAGEGMSGQDPVQRAIADVDVMARGQQFLKMEKVAVAEVRLLTDEQDLLNQGRIETLGTGMLGIAMDERRDAVEPELLLQLFDSSGGKT